MTRHIDESMLHDLAEGLLSPGEARDIRGHLDSCDACRHTYEELRDLLRSMADLPKEAEPSRDLWPQIAWRMEGLERSGAPGGSDGDLQIPGASSPRRRPRRFSLSAWQLAAASVALMVLSGAAVWAVLSGGTTVQTGPAGQVPGTAQFVSWEESYGGYDEAVADLESFLEQGRELLDPQTVGVLEENLRTIDEAIQEARQALAQDPASDILQRFLADHLRKKVDLLRQAAGAVHAVT